jgi:hypothetical protein
MENDVLDTDSFSVSDLNPTTDFVEIEGYDNGDGSVFATEVKVKETSEEAPEIVVQGVIDADTTVNDTITVLGVTFSITPSTTIEDDDDNPIDKSLLVPGQSIVEIKDANADGTAESIEVESL